jgi:DEAD/DEAH box helicase domain-containing protein
MELFDKEEKDNLFLNETKYRGTINKLNTTPHWKGANKELLKTRNSLERMLWQLSISSDDSTKAETGLYAACFQSIFATPSFSEENAKRLLDPDELVDNTSKELSPDGNFYMLSELTQANELFKSRVFVRLKDFNLLSSLNAEKLSEIKKDVWEEFWRLYCLLKV